MNIRTDVWYTPPEVCAMVRMVLGGIDIDPASEPMANANVQADMYYTHHDNALGMERWGSGPGSVSVFLNPPRGRLGGRSLACLFWMRLMQEVELGHVSHAIFMAFSAEALQNTQGKGVPPIASFPFCVPAKRIKFIRPGQACRSPSHSNVIAYVPGTIDRTSEFCSVFSQLGAVCNSCSACGKTLANAREA